MAGAEAERLAGARLERLVPALSSRLPRVFLDRSILFPVLVGIGALNGLAARILDSTQALGWAGALAATFGVSAILWVALMIAMDLLRQEPAPASTADIAVALCALLTFVVPVAPLAWIGLTILSIGIVRASRKGGPAWRGGWIALGITGPAFWTPMIFKVISGPILAADAALVSWTLNLPRTGNVVALADGSGSLWIAPACSSLANVSLAVLAWLTFIRADGLPVTPRSFGWCLLGCASIVGLNAIRIGLIALYPAHFETIHGPVGSSILNWTTLVIMTAIGFAAVRSGRARLA